MQYLKKTILLLSAVTAVTAQAQNLDFGVRFGGNLTNIKGFDKAQVGYEGGVFARYHLPKAESVFVESGLSFTKTAWTLHSAPSAVVTQTNKAYPVSLQLPLYVGYRLPLGNRFALSFAGNVYGSVGLFGKGSVEKMPWAQYGTPTPPVATYKYQEISNIFSENYIRRFEWGMGLRIGAELGDRWEVHLAHRWAMNRFFTDEVHISNAPAGFAKNKVLSLSVGYKF